jgi:hypothetical protein
MIVSFAAYRLAEERLTNKNSTLMANAFMHFWKDLWSYLHDASVNPEMNPFLPSSLSCQVLRTG